MGFIAMLAGCSGDSPTAKLVASKQVLTALESASKSVVMRTLTVRAATALAAKTEREVNSPREA